MTSTPLHFIVKQKYVMSLDSINYLCALSYVVVIRVFMQSIGLYSLYSKMGLKNNWIALIPIYCYKPLFDLTYVCHNLLLLSFIPGIGIYIFNILLCYVMIHVGRIFNKGILFTTALVLLPEVFLLVLSFTDLEVPEQEPSEIELLKREILRRENLSQSDEKM